MFERFTEHARQVLIYSRDEAGKRGHAAIEPGHLLLGVIRDSTGFNNALTVHLRAPLHELKASIEDSIPSFKRIPKSTAIPFTREAKRVLQFTVEETDKLEHKLVGAGHILLGLLRESDDFSANMLNVYGLNLSAVRIALQSSKGGPEYAFVQVIHDVTPAFLRSIQEDPHRLRDLTPEQFEHVAAERLIRMGFAVTLTGATNRKDGGIDIIGAKRDPALGNFLIAAQVKHHRDEHKVGREAVDRLISLKGGVFNFALLVTNTTFTQDAKWVAAQAQNQYFAKLRDFEDVKKWLEENFSGERDYSDLPDEIELAPGVKIKIARPDFSKLKLD